MKRIIKETASIANESIIRISWVSTEYISKFKYSSSKLKVPWRPMSYSMLLTSSKNFSPFSAGFVISIVSIVKWNYSIRAQLSLWFIIWAYWFPITSPFNHFGRHFCNCSGSMVFLKTSIPSGVNSHAPVSIQALNFWNQEFRELGLNHLVSHVSQRCIACSNFRC